jgi:hypothetical protein
MKECRNEDGTRQPEKSNLEKKHFLSLNTNRTFGDEDEDDDDDDDDEEMEESLFVKRYNGDRSHSFLIGYDTWS